MVRMVKGKVSNDTPHYFIGRLWDRRQTDVLFRGFARFMRLAVTPAGVELYCK